MVLKDFFDRNIMEALESLKESAAVVEYSKVEGDEFLKLPDEGCYLQARNGTGRLSQCRIYFEPSENYFPAKLSTRGEFAELETISDFAQKLGPPLKDIRAVRIPGAAPTLPGQMFAWDDKLVSVYSEDNARVAYIHIKER